jgi:endonuclease YncB( thermonuclease family)
MRLRFPIIVAALSTLAAVTAAQEAGRTSVASVVAVGSRVRLRSSAVQGRPTGVVAALDGDTLTMATDYGALPVKIPLASISTLETSLGRKRNALQGLAIGLASGALLGLILPVDPDDCGPDSTNLCSRGEAVSGTSLALGLIGAGWGALVKSDRWRVVTLNPARPQAQHGPRGVGLAIAVRF